MIDSLKKIKSNIISPWLVCLLTISSFVLLIDKDVFNGVFDSLLYVYFGALLIFLIDIRNFSMPYIVVLAINVFLPLITLMLNVGGVGSVLTYAFSISLVFAIAHTKFDKRQAVILCVASIIVIIAIFCYSFYYVQNRAEIISELINPINPNTFAEFLSFTFILACCLINLKFKNKLISKIILVVTASIIMIGVVNYRARTSMGALFVFVLLNLLPKKWITKKVITIVALSIFVFQIVFPFIYLSIYKAGIIFDFFGKNFFTGREILWSTMFEYFKEEPLRMVFGLGSKVSLYEGVMLGANNNIWVVITNFGLLGFFAYLTFMFLMFKNLQLNTDTQIKFFFMYIACVLLGGCTEVITFWEPTFMLTSIGLGFACNKHFKNNSEFILDFTKR